MHSKFFKISAAVFFAAALFSCSFDAPESDKGSISMRLPDKSQLGAACANGVSRSVSSDGSLSAGSVDQFKVVVRNISSRESITQFVAPGSSVTVDELEPGSWDVAIFGYANDPQGGSGQSIRYYGNARGIPVEGGETSNATVRLYRVEGNTLFDFTLAPDASGAAASRSSVRKAYVVYSCDELGQSGTVFYDYAEPQGGSNPQPADTSKIIIPVPDFLEPGYTCSAKVYLFTSDNVGGGYKTLWNGTVAGKAQAGGTLSGDLAYTETCLVNSNMGTNHTYIRMDKAFSNELYNNMGYEFAPQTSGSTGTAIDYADLEIFPAVADSCGDSAPLIVKYQDMLWTDNFEFKHLSAVPSIVVPGMVTESTGAKKLYIPDFVSRTLSTPTFSPSAPTQFKVCEAAPSDDYGFAKYSVSGTETDSWSAPFQYVSTDPSGAAKNVEFTAPSTFYPKSQGATDGFTCNTVIARGTHGYFVDAEAATTKSVSVPFTVQGASWTATGPGDVMLYSPFTITLECAAALASELDAVLPSLTVNVGTSEITGVTKARSGSKIVLSVPGQDTWSAGEQKTLSIEYNSYQLGNDVMVNIAQPTSGGGGSGGGNGGGGGSGNVPEGFVFVEGTTINSAVSGSSVFLDGRKIVIPDMLVCTHEVTQGEYEQYCIYPGSKPSDSYGKGTNYPAYYVCWYDAILYCNLRSAAEGLEPVYYVVTDGTTNTASLDWTAGTKRYDINDWTTVYDGYFIRTDTTTGKLYCYTTDMAQVLNSSNRGVTMDKSRNGYRLLTEAEWEYCARGGKNGIAGAQTTYSGSDTLENVAWCRANSGGKTHPVCTDKVDGVDSFNTLGLYDMSGNVAEYVYDWYGASAINSTTPETGYIYNSSDNQSRSKRGGYFDSNYDSDFYVKSRSSCGEYRGQEVGFRICRNASARNVTGFNGIWSISPPARQTVARNTGVVNFFFQNNTASSSDYASFDPSKLQIKYGDTTYNFDSTTMEYEPQSTGVLWKMTNPNTSSGDMWFTFTYDGVEIGYGRTLTN